MPVKKNTTIKDTAKKEKSFEETLWDTDNKLRGYVEFSEYKHVVLSLICLWFLPKNKKNDSKRNTLTSLAA